MGLLAPPVSTVTPAFVLMIAVAVLVPALTLAAWLRWRRCLPMDVANARSLHTGAVPRIGGAAMAVGGVVVLVGVGWAPTSWPLLILLWVAGGLCLFSMIDDWMSLPVLPRLAGHLVAAVIAVAVLDVPPFLAVLLALTLAWMTNLYNFMDGADGLAGSMALVGFLAYGLAAMATHPQLGLVCFVLAALATGFLGFNLPAAKVFMGDAGSVPLGFLAGALGVYGWKAGAWTVEFPLLVFLPFIGDATVTLGRRLVARDRVWQPHREHYYQRLIRLGWSHGRVLAAEAVFMVLTASSALMLEGLSELARVSIVGGWVGAMAIAMIWIDVRWRIARDLEGSSGR